MRNVETCTIKIVMEENFDCNESYNRFDPEDIVKNAWGRMVPWFTERHGVRSGNLTLEGGHSVRIEWKYETDFEAPTQDEMGCPASAIEARSDATPQSGAAEGESATAASGDAHA